MKQNNRACLAIIIVGLAAACVKAFGQIDMVGGEAADPGQFPWQGFIAPVVFGVIWGLKKLLPKLPPMAILVLAPVLGAVVDYVIAQAGAWDPSGTTGAAMGALATYLHQLTKQAQKPKVSTDAGAAGSS